MPGAGPGWQIGEEEALAFRRGDLDQAEMERVLGAPYSHIGIDGSAVELQDLRVKQNVEVDAGTKLPCDVAADNRVDLGLPVIFEENHKPHPLRIIGPQ